MRFIDKVRAILNSGSYVEGLENESLRPVALSTTFGKIPHRLDPLDIRKILRLQTLAQQESALSERVDNACIQADSQMRIWMLQQIITEIVRDAAPMETNCFNRVYFVASDGNVYSANGPVIQKFN